MKTIENKTPVVDVNMEGCERADYATIAKFCLNVPPESGFKLDDMRARFKVIDKLEHATNGKIELEDAEFAKLHSAAKAVTWRVLSRGVVEFLDYLDEVAKS